MYQRFYGLREKPFNIAPDPAFLFRSDIHREALANLAYAIREGTGFVVLTGEVGTGKTLILHTLLSELEDSVQSAYIFYPKISFKDMLRMILNELDRPARGENLSESDLLTQLNNYLIERFQRNLSTVLIIDEAQDLDDDLLENIRLLSNLETSKSKLLTIILVGQPELHQKLERPELRQLRQRIVVRFHMTPLDKKEVRSYIQHRLRVAGAHDLEIFNDRAIARIAGYSEGIPRLINILCDNALLLGYAEEEPVIGVSMIDEVIRDLEGGPLATAPDRLAQTVRRKNRKRRRWQPVAVAVFALLFISFAAFAFANNWFNVRANFTAIPTPPFPESDTLSPNSAPAETPVPAAAREAPEAEATPAERQVQVPTVVPEVNVVADPDTRIAAAGDPPEAPPPDPAPRATVQPEIPTRLPAVTAPVETPSEITEPTVNPAVTSTATVPLARPSPPTPTPRPEPSPTPVPPVEETLADGLRSGGTEGLGATGRGEESAPPAPVVEPDSERSPQEVRIIGRTESENTREGEVAIQVASFISRDRAADSARLLERLGAQPLIAQPLEDERGIGWIRVFAVDFESTAEAEGFLERTRGIRSISQAQPFIVYIERGPARDVAAGGSTEP